MKDLHSTQSLPSARRRGLLTTIPVFAAVFLLGYVLGLLSAFSSSNSFSHSNSPSPINHSISTPKTTDTKVVRQVEPSLSSSSPPSLQPPLPPPHDLFRFRTKCSDPVPHPQVLKTILSRVYNGTSPYEYFPSQETSSLLLPVPSQLRGWGSRNRVFADLITTVRPLTIIELGTFLGASALHMASIARNLSLPSLILCLDDFRGWPGFRAKYPRDVPPSHHADSLLLHQFMLNVIAAGESDRVVPMPFSTGSSLASLCELGVYGDLIEVDAGHDFHSAWADINMAYAVLRPGGVLFGHDYFTVADNRGVRRAVNLFAKVYGLRVQANGEHWVLSPKPQS